MNIILWVVIFIYKRFVTGATANFFGEYLSQALFNYLENQPINSNLKTSSYIAAIISGGFANTIFPRIKSLLGKTVLITGLTRSLVDQIDRLLGGEGLNHETYLEDFIFDVIIIYYIALVFTKIGELIRNKNKESSWDAKIISNLPLSIAINMYLNYRYREESQDRVS